MNKIMEITLEMRAAEMLRLARRLAPGPERNDLRQIAMILRALARLAPRSLQSEDG